MATTKLWIIQSWENPFLVWDPAKYSGLDQVRLSFKEVWVPDIRLQNIPYTPKVDNPSTLPLYKNWVTVHSNGTNIWKSLELTDSECNMKSTDFPFDKQKCYLNFSSDSYDSMMLGINLTGKFVYSEEEEETLSSGEWKIWGINISTMEMRSGPMSSSFTQVSIILHGERLISFYLFYYIVPCGVLALLMFTTFIIPPENGERIGFCSSLLIALSVYLLLFSEMLPSSRHVSLIGVLFVIVYLETALVLLATVLVLKAFHATKPVPKLLKMVYGGGIKKKVNKIKPAISMKALNLTWKKNQAKEEKEEREIEVASVPADEESQREEQQHEEQEWSLEDHQRCWSRIARSLDRFFFWFFLIILLLSLFYIITKSNDIVKGSIF